MVAPVEQPADHLAPDPAPLVSRQHDDCADVGVESAVGHRASVADQHLAIVSGDAVHGSSNHLSQPLAVAGAMLPPDGVEELGELPEVQRMGSVAVLNHDGNPRQRIHDATLPPVREYYEARASEYDDWWLGKGSFAKQERPGWFEEVFGVAGGLASLPAARTLDVACGTGFLTKFLHGDVIGLDQSESMLRIAGSSAPNARFVQGDALALPFPPSSFERVLAGHFYGQLEEQARLRFLAEARRVSRELVVVDAAVREGVPATSWQDRVLNDGSRWQVYKRYFSPEQLLREIGGGAVLFAGRWFVVVRTELPTTAQHQGTPECWNSDPPASIG